MKTAVLLLAVTLSGSALAQTGVAQGASTTQNLTGSAPTLATDGVSVAGASGYTVVVSANAGQTISGGSLLCYYYGCVTWNPAGNVCSFLRWMRCPTSLDFTPATGARDAPSGDFSTPTAYGRIQYITSSVTVSSGTTVLVTVTARKSK